MLKVNSNVNSAGPMGTRANQIAAQSDFMRAQAKKLIVDPYLAEDLAQDAILVALQNQDKFDGNNLKGWLWQILRNTFVNQYRRDKKHQALSDGYEWLQDSGILSNSTPNEALIGFAEADLTRAVNQLPIALVPVALLRMRNYQYQEIACILKIPIGTVRQRLFRVRQKLISQDIY